MNQQDIRLGFPPVLQALYAAEPRQSAYTPARGRRSIEEDSDRAAADAFLTEELPVPAAVVKHREPAYCPEGWGGFQWHSPRGTGEVVRPVESDSTAPRNAQQFGVSVAIQFDDGGWTQVSG